MTHKYFLCMHGAKAHNYFTVFRGSLQPIRVKLFGYTFVVTRSSLLALIKYKAIEGSKS